MGARMTANVRNEADYEILCCEKSEEAAKRIGNEGLTVAPAAEAARRADIVVLAVPDRLIGTISRELVPFVKRGATVLLLDPAAACAGELELGEGINCVVAHPCHPPLFGEQTTDAARKDHFGGIAAWQDFVIALVKGDERAVEEAEKFLKTAWKPVRRAHRVTLEQMAILEPTMAEVVAASAAVLMKEALEEAVKAGVPRDAAESFMLGHAQIPLAIVFGAVSSPFSDAAKIAIAWGTERVIRPDWRRVFEPGNVRAAIKAMLHPEKPR
jgi:hypothetical protein